MQSISPKDAVRRKYPNSVCLLFYRAWKPYYELWTDKTDGFLLSEGNSPKEAWAKAAAKLNSENS
jgi:hypothetical protein